MNTLFDWFSRLRRLVRVTKRPERRRAPRESGATTNRSHLNWLPFAF